MRNINSECAEGTTNIEQNLKQAVIVVGPSNGWESNHQLIYLLVPNDLVLVFLLPPKHRHRK
jgi:hypothetical protein